MSIFLRSLSLSRHFVAFAWLALAAASAQSAVATASAQSVARTVNCDSGNTIRSALITAKPGDTILVSGTCRESVFIQAEVTRIALIGQRRATIWHPGGETRPGPAAHAVYIRGRMITLAGFRIVGAPEDGVHLSGPASAVIDDNIIVRNKSAGVHVDKGSVAQLVNNRIMENAAGGIYVAEQSYARIGFLIPPDSVARPNIIESNGAAGIRIERGSNGWIVGNTITGNNGPGVVVDRSSEADIVGNTINGNYGDGIVTTHNSGVNLESAGSPRHEGPNRTDPALKNRGVGVRCSIGGYVDGPLGTLSGVRGAKQIDQTCVDRVRIR